MKVLILTADYPPRAWSGIGTAVARQARALGELGVDATVLVGRPGRRPPARAAGPSRVLSLAGPRFPVDPRGFDVVHLHSLCLAELAAELRRRFGLPLVYTAHALVDREAEPSRPTTAFWSAVQRRVMALARKVVFLSAAERAAALAREPRLAARATVIPNGLPPPRPRRRRGAADGAGPLVFAGRFAASKGLAVLAAAAPPILERYPGRLVLAGGHGDAAGRRAVRRLRETCGQRCQVAGWLGREALDELLASASLVLVPSLYEPFGQVALEAMAVGAPVLAASVGGLAEVAGPGSGGRLVAGHQPAAWAAAALAILDDPAEQARLRRQGPPYVATRFAIAAVARRLAEEAYAA
jgi:glycogen(starch) synthase